MSLSSRTLIRSSRFNNKYYIAIFIVALSTLFLEFTLTRILSVTLWYHFAFMVISVALLGFGISGVVLAVSKKIKEYDPDKLLSILSIAYGVSVIGCFILMNKIPFDPFSLFTDSMQFLYLPAYYLLITIPFFFSGLIISYLLSNFKEQIPKLYFADLVGAGLSCIAFVIFVPMLGGNGAIVIIAALGFISALIFSSGNSKGLSLASFIILLLSSSLLLNKDTTLAVNSTPNKIYGNFIKSRPDLKVRTDWNTFSKIDVMMDEDEPEDGYSLLLAIIDDGNATTNIPALTQLPPPGKPADAANLAFAPLDSIGNVFILGSAGGGEILTSLYHDANWIHAVEINGILNDYISNQLRFWTGPLVNNPNVTLVTDDARSVIGRKRIAYDVIISAHTISSSAVSSGAMSMVENYILTQEAVEKYLNHLSNEGVMYITRPETQIPKIISTLKKARLNTSHGFEHSKDHFIVFRRPPTEFEGDKSFLAGVLYKKNGFTEQEVINVLNEASMLNLNVEYDPLSKPDGIYKELIETENIDEVISQFPTDIKPATDDKPFFDNNIGFSRMTLEGMKESFAQDEKGIFALKDRPVAETTLLVILLQTIIVAGLFILLPLRKLKSDGKPFNKSYLTYFACLGLGYIMLQICMIQKFTMFLGQPVFTLLTVVSTMLVASGFGSMFSHKFVSKSKINLYLIFGLVFLISVLIGFLNPIIFEAGSRWDLWLRIIISILIIAPLGFFMGMPFPLGLSLIDEENKKFIAFAWGINGFFSVIGTVLAMIFAMILGFKIVFIISGIIYLLAFIIIKARLKNSGGFKFA